MHQENTRYKVSAIAAVLAAGFASPGFAADSGPEFFVATTDKTNIYDFFPFGPYPVVARGESGDFVVVYYRTTNNVDRTFARAYNADGTPKGDAFQVGYNSNVASAAMDPSGNFVIAWTQATGGTTGGPSDHAFAQRFSSDGTPQGAPIDVGASPTDYGVRTITVSTPPEIAMDHDGDFAVAWSTQKDVGFIRSGYFFLTNFESSKTYAALYKGDGTLIKAATVIDNVPAKLLVNDGKHYNFDTLNGLAMDADGDLVMSFDTGRGTTKQAAVRRFNAALQAKGGLSTLPDVKQFTDLGIDANGNFAIEWTDPADSSLHVSRYTADAALLGNIGPIETPTTPHASVEQPTLSMAPSGVFAVTWGVTTQVDFFGNGAIFDSYNKYAQYFHADGTANGAPFVIDDNADHLNDSNMNTAIDGQGDIISIWSGLLDDRETNAVIGRLTTAP